MCHFLPFSSVTTHTRGIIMSHIFHIRVFHHCLSTFSSLAHPFTAPGDILILTYEKHMKKPFPLPLRHASSQYRCFSRVAGSYNLIPSTRDYCLFSQTWNAKRRNVSVGVTKASHNNVTCLLFGNMRDLFHPLIPYPPPIHLYPRLPFPFASLSQIPFFVVVNNVTSTLTPSPILVLITQPSWQMTDVMKFSASISHPPPRSQRIPFHVISTYIRW